MQISAIRVLHYSLHRSQPPAKTASAFGEVSASEGFARASGEVLSGELRFVLGQCVVIESCLRKIWVTSADHLQRTGSLSLWETVSSEGFEHFSGADAYEFLLRVASGLESQIAGETDIFGQVKEAWNQAQFEGNAERELIQELTPWFQRLYEDTKEIRSRYLQHLGGSSYGSLVRRCLSSNAGPILLVGAGQLARSVAPYLLEQELWIWNRSRASLESLYRDLLAHDPRFPVRMLHSEKGPQSILPESELKAWSEAAQVIVCVPFDAQRDVLRLRAWQRGELFPQQRAMVRESPRRLVHLGGMRAQSGVWQECPDLVALDDLFALERAQGQLRAAQIQQARRAARERAQLRLLGPSVSIAHGWEDLAVFS